jgi:hypothetical protein
MKGHAFTLGQLNRAAPARQLLSTWRDVSADALLGAALAPAMTQAMKRSAGAVSTWRRCCSPTSIAVSS